MMRVAVLSDTHNLLRPSALDFIRGADHILHAGDLCSPAILAQLAAIAPLTAVRGNNDLGTWAQALRTTEIVRLGEVFVGMVHDLEDLDVDPAGAGLQVVVSGHSHRPLVEQRGGVCFLNPGSAGPRRFRLPIAVAELTIVGASVSARVVEIGE
jgi:putative phosphoesterase